MSTKTTSSPSPKKVSAAAVTTTPTLNKNLVITNNSSINLAIIDAAATDDNQVVFEQSLKLLPTIDGKQSIAANSSGTVVLDDTHDNNGTPTYTKLYDIIYAKTDTLFPVKSQGAMLNFKTQDYAPVAVTDDEAKIMQETEVFTQTIAAYPTSQLAKDYIAALQGSTNNASSEDDIDDAVASFFASTNSYKDVTLDSLIALKSYYNTYPMVWTGYQSSKTYYLYSSDGTTVISNGSLTVTIPSTIGLDKSLPGFSFTYKDANNNTKALHYANGQFVDDPNADVPNICLVGTFILKSTITKVDTDTDIITILSGNVYNNTVIGYETPLPDNSNNGGGGDSSGNWSGLYTLLHPKDAAGWMQLFLTFVGVVMGIDFLLKGVKSAKDSVLEAKDKLGDLFTKADADKAISEAKAKSGLNDPKYKSEMKKIKADNAANKNLDDQIKDADTIYQDRVTEDWRTSTDEKLDSIGDMLQKMLDSGHATTDMENAGDALGDAYTSTDTPSTSDLSSQIDGLNKTIEGLQSTLNAQYETIINKLKGEAQTELSESKAAADKAKEVTDKVSDDLEKAKERQAPEDVKPERSGMEVEA
ncbi:hypothetical protein DC498_11075 [Terrimonas sp.]|uniref:hypothetical protein n=1 Tax=Terrimonas sp. TaxID=1914338 RepID=UPI000D517FB8|nr:hypothetical protein [Terrimonas sp.]PVD52258.1 hypothetical protein DC498_11075 [Terrimonas sp.]